MKAQRIDPQTETATSTGFHSPFYPEFVRPGEILKAELAIDGSPHFEPHQVWRISPLGVEILVDPAKPKLAFSEKVDLAIKYGDTSILHKGLIVSHTINESGKTLLAIRWINEESSELPQTEKRQSNRWLCGQEYLPTGVVINPLQFNDFIHFRIVDISRSGMRIRTSMRNKLVVPGMKLEGMATFPLVGQSNIRYEIVHPKVVRQDGKEYLELGCKYLEASNQLRELIAQYLLQFGPAVTPDELRKENLEIRTVNPAVTFSNVRTEEDYRKVLNLRRLAWTHSGKVTTDLTPDAFADEYDARSRILTASYKGEIVASLRLVFPQENEKLEHEQYISLPESLPRLDEIVEITRVVVHPEYRGADLLYLLFKHTALTCIQAGKRYILGNSEKKLLPMYRKIGFDILPVEFEIKKLGIRPVLFLGDVHKAIAGIGVNPLVWNIMYSDLVQFISHGELLRFGTGANLRMAMFRLLGPLSRAAAAKLQKSRGKKLPSRDKIETAKSI